MQQIESYIKQRLEQREQDGGLRRLVTEKQLVDFCSNDYLGLARSEELRSLIDKELRSTQFIWGSTGSRLISGNSAFTEELENQIAAFHTSSSALIFNSGYDANIGLFSALAQRGDTIITDELIHASIIDGSRLSFANRYSFKHNDLNSLEEKLRQAKGKIFIAVESVYSMDGDEAPLKEIAHLAERNGAALIVDEAHSAGVFGKQGRGLVSELGLEGSVFARLITFGKALGCHGAAVLGSDLLRSYLVNFARSFIFTTASSPFSHLSVQAAYSLLQKHNMQVLLKEKIELFKNETSDIRQSFIASRSPIQCVITGGNERSRFLESEIHAAGFDVRAILHPTVPQGKERLRICLHSFNTEKEIKQLSALLREHL